jgi:hypothetical protein
MIDATVLSGDKPLCPTCLANDRLDEAIYQAGVTTAEVSPVNGRAADVAWVVLIAAESLSDHDDA